MQNKLIGTFTQRPKEISEPVDTSKKIVKCANCDEDLVAIAEVLAIKSKNSRQFIDNGENKKEEVSLNYKFECPHCGGASFIQKLTHKPFIQPINCKFEDIIEENGTWLVKLKPAP